MTDRELDRLVNAAKRHGWPRERWEEATQIYDDPRALALLASRLREIKPRQGKGSAFELRAKERRWLATRLIEEGHADDETARDRIGISRTTFWRVKGEVEEAADHAVSKLEELDLSLIPAPRGWSASSGTDDGWRDL